MQKQAHIWCQQSGSKTMTEKELQECLGKQIIVITDDGGVFAGHCECFTSSLDNDNGIASIDINVGDFVYELYLNEIKTIKLSV